MQSKEFLHVGCNPNWSNFGQRLHILRRGVHGVYEVIFTSQVSRGFGVGQSPSFCNGYRGYSSLFCRTHSMWTMVLYNEMYIRRCNAFSNRVIHREYVDELIILSVFSLYFGLLGKAP